MRFVPIWYNNKYTLLIMGRSKQTYYGSCFVASYMHNLQSYNWKKCWPIHYEKGPSNFSDMGPWAHTLLFLGNTLKFIQCNIIRCDCTLTGDILEVGAQWAIAKKDVGAFERYMAQLKCYYLDYRLVITATHSLTASSALYQKYCFAFTSVCSDTSLEVPFRQYT